MYVHMKSLMTCKMGWYFIVLSKFHWCRREFILNDRKRNPRTTSNDCPQNVRLLIHLSCKEFLWHLDIIKCLIASDHDITHEVTLLEHNYNTLSWSEGKTSPRLYSGSSCGDLVRNLTVLTVFRCNRCASQITWYSLQKTY